MKVILEMCIASISDWFENSKAAVRTLEAMMCHYCGKGFASHVGEAKLV